MTGSVWGLPLDSADLAKDAVSLLRHIGRDNRRGFEHDLKMWRVHYIAELWTYLAVIAIGIEKASDPVDEGLTLDVADEQSLRYAVDRFAHPVLAETVYSLLYKISTGDYEQVAQYFADHYHGAAWKDTLAVFWTLGKVVQWMREGSDIHSRFAVRAALLRLMLAAAWEHVRKHEWSEADLAAAADLAVLLNDRNIQSPGDDWI